MAYRLAIKADVEKEVRRIARKEVKKALKELANERISVHERIHETRKRLKKIRGVARLVRPALGQSYAAENAFFRDLGRKLAEARDVGALLETVERLAPRAQRQEESAALNRAHCELAAQREGVEVSSGTAIASVGDEVEHAAQRMRHWDLDPKGFWAVGRGLRKTYIRGRRGVRKAYASGAVEDFHDWRKRVKYHRYHTHLLRDVWPEQMETRERELNKLSGLLGEEHDLAVLDDFLAASGIDCLFDLTARVRAELRAAALPLGERLFAEKSKQFTRRVKAYWEVAQKV